MHCPANRHNCMCSWVEATLGKSGQPSTVHTSMLEAHRGRMCMCVYILCLSLAWASVASVPACQRASQQSVCLSSPSVSLSLTCPASCLPARPSLRVCMRACARGWPGDPSQVTLTLTLSLSLSLPPTITTHQHEHHQPAAALPRTGHFTCRSAPSLLWGCLARLRGWGPSPRPRLGQSLATKAYLHPPPPAT